MEDEDTGQAFLFFNLFVNVSYFVQLQSWSLKKGKPKITKEFPQKTKKTKFLWNEQNWRELIGIHLDSW